MVSAVHLDKRADHCDGHQQIQNNLDWNENGRAFSSRTEWEEADKFSSSGQSIPLATVEQWYLRVIESMT